MAETSNGRVTITLGRSGQVVKRGATVSESYSRSQPTVGSKRSVRDRLGGNIDSSTTRGSHFSSKRQRADSSLTSLGGSGVEDVNIGKNDLRFKLQRKNLLRRVQCDDDIKDMDLRDKLSSTVRNPAPPVISYDTQQRMPQPKETSMLGRIPPIRSADDLHLMESSRNSNSAWTLDHIRRRSPDRIVSTSRGMSPPRNVSRGMSPQRKFSRGMSPQRNFSRGMSPPRNVYRGLSPPRIVSRGMSPPRNVSRGLSPPRNFEGLQHRPLSRTIPYMSKDALDTPRSVSSSAPFMSKPVLPPLSSKPMAPSPGQRPPWSAVLQKPPFIGEEQQTVEGLLHALGLGKYAITFKAEEVDLAALKQMGENDLKELGIPMGPRKKILLAITPRKRQQQP